MKHKNYFLSSPKNQSDEAETPPCRALRNRISPLATSIWLKYNTDINLSVQNWQQKQSSVEKQKSSNRHQLNGFAGVR